MYFNGPYDSDLSVAIYEHDQIYLKEIREKNQLYVNMLSMNDKFNFDCYARS